MQRTEDQILSKAPIEVTFGDKKYYIPVLTIKAQREWRERVATEVGQIMNGMSGTVDNKTIPQLSRGFTSALIQFPEKLADLVFAYDLSLPQNVILEEATEEQISAAFSLIMSVAYPFLASLTLLKQAMGNR